MTGTIVNVATVLVGSSLGLMFRHRLSQKVVAVVFQGIGLFTLVLGVSMFLRSQWFLVVILSLVFGATVGSVLDLEEKTERFSQRLKRSFKFREERFTEGLVTAFLMFCMGSLTILGAVEEGMGNGPELLITKSILDGFSSMALAAALGSGVILSVVPLFLFQGTLTLLSMWLGNFFVDSMIDALTATGGVLLVGLGINILNLAKIKVIDLLPALLFVLLFGWMKYQNFLPFV